MCITHNIIHRYTHMYMYVYIETHTCMHTGMLYVSICTHGESVSVFKGMSQVPTTSWF